MKRLWLAACVAVFISCISSVGWCEEPQKVTVCQLKADPPAYNHKFVEVEGFISHGFEDFSLFDPACLAYPEIWLEYGGTAKSDTVYCCGPTAGRTRPHELEVDGVLVPLIEDDLFRRFDRRIQGSGQRYTMTHATIVGRFFAGRKETYPSGISAWGGFGHFGCCSLLAIQGIKEANFEDRGDLDPGGVPMTPVAEFQKRPCGNHDLTSDGAAKKMIEYQAEADSGSRSWAFDDPRRVAFEVIEKNEDGKAPDSSLLREIDKALGSLEYELKWRSAHKTYTISVSRPYWLSFYASDPRRVAWVVMSASVSTCEKESPKSLPN